MELMKNDKDIKIVTLFKYTQYFFINKKLNIDDAINSQLK